jgi:hypothetical protein
MRYPISLEREVVKKAKALLDQGCYETVMIMWVEAVFEPYVKTAPDGVRAADSLLGFVSVPYDGIGCSASPGPWC